MYTKTMSGLDAGSTLEKGVRMKIDVHCHTYPVEYVKEVEKLSGGDAEKVLFYAEIPIPIWDSAEKRIAKMDELGIDMEILSTTLPPQSYGKEADLRLAQMTNDFNADLCAKYPKRFKAFANVPFFDPDNAVKELHRAINELGFVGIATGTFISRIPIMSPAYLPFLSEVNRMKLPIHLHPSIPIGIEIMKQNHLGGFLGFLFETTMTGIKMVFDGVFEKFPDIGMILSHFGATIPFMYQRLDDGYKGFPEFRGTMSKLPSEYLKRFYYDTASSFTRSSFMCTYDLCGPDKIVFGTDDPYARNRLIEIKIKQLNGLGLGEDVMANIYSESAKKALNLKA
jgi:predicted TIM-barrel fold metal-dependent hydrolase